MIDWLLRIFDTSGFVPRWTCGTWSAQLGWLHIASDLAVWLAYMGIPAVLLWFLLRRRDLPSPRLLLLFVLFIGSCGLSHLTEAAMFWWPAYRLSGAVKLVTAVVSLTTLVMLVPFARRAAELPGTANLLALLNAQSALASRSQEQLQLSQEQLRVATMASGIGFWDWRREGDRLTVDANTRTMLSLLGDFLAGTHRDDLLAAIHADDREELDAAIRTSLETAAPFAVRCRAGRGDGHVAHLVVRGAPVHDAEHAIVGMAGAVFDVTEEERSRELFRIAVEASPNAMLMVDRHGDVVLANSQAETVFGRARDDLVGRTVDDLVPADVLPRHRGLRDGYFAAPTQRKLGAGRELAGRRADGTEVPLEIALSPVLLASGPGVLAAIVDISERTELQRKLSQAERLAGVGELAAGVAHEINNPVNTMINCAQLVLDGDPAPEHCRTIIEEGARIAAIVRDLLQFARDDRSRAQPIVLADTVGRTVNLLGESLRRRGIRLAVQLPDDLPRVHAHPQQLQQVLLNLLINAKDALEQTTGDAERCIEIHGAVEPDGRVGCSVRDNGPGIPPELVARIFDPFVTTKRARGGTGLGLSISRSIIESFGGRLDVASRLGEGTDFRFVLAPADPTDSWMDELAD